MKRVFFNGCSFNLRGKGGELIKKPWAVSTSDMRLIQILDQHKCSGDHQHEPAMGGNAAHTAYYTPEMASKILEALYPNKFYRSVPSVQHGSAFVTLNLSRSQWLNDERGVQAVQKEADGPEPTKLGTAKRSIPFRTGRLGPGIPTSRFMSRTF